MTSGIQPPLVNFVMLAAKNNDSPTPTKATTRASRQQLQCHSDLAASRNSVVVSSSVPVTASPYAVARRSDERKARISASTPRNSSQLMAPM